MSRNLSVKETLYDRNLKDVQLDIGKLKIHKYKNERDPKSKKISYISKPENSICEIVSNIQLPRPMIQNAQFLLKGAQRIRDYSSVEHSQPNVPISISNLDHRDPRHDV